MEDIRKKISLKNELLRKTIHLFSAVIPISYYFIDRYPEIIFLGVLSFSFLIIDLLRIKSEHFKAFYLKFLRPVLRYHEVDNYKTLFTGGTYLVWGYLLCVIIFPKPIAITSMFLIIFCDTFAAIAGKVYGKHFIANKTVEGSTAFFITGVIIIFLTPKVTNLRSEYLIGIVSVLITSLFELLPFKIDDNILIPVFFGIIYSVLLKIILL